MLSQIVFSCFAQDTITTYLDSRWKKTASSDYKYKRVIFKIGENHYQVEDYLKNSQAVFKGQFKSDKVKNPYGEFINYDENGTIREVYNFNFEGKLDKEYNVFTEKGTKDSERFYSNGKKHGLWKWYYDNGSVCWFEQWRNDTLVMMQQFSPEGQEFINFYNVSIAPKWIHDDKTLSQFLKEKLPAKYKKESINADLMLFISSEGKVQRIESKTKIDTAILNSIEQILVDGPVWLPALEHLRPNDGVLEIEIRL